LPSGSSGFEGMVFKRGDRGHNGWGRGGRPKLQKGRARFDQKFFNDFLEKGEEELVSDKRKNGIRTGRPGSMQGKRLIVGKGAAAHKGKGGRGERMCPAWRVTTSQGKKDGADRKKVSSSAKRETLSFKGETGGPTLR